MIRQESWGSLNNRAAVGFTTLTSKGGKDWAAKKKYGSFKGSRALKNDISLQKYFALYLANVLPHPHQCGIFQAHICLKKSQYIDCSIFSSGISLIEYQTFSIKHPSKYSKSSIFSPINASWFKISSGHGNFSKFTVLFTNSNYFSLFFFFQFHG